MIEVRAKPCCTADTLRSRHPRLSGDTTMDAAAGSSDARIGSSISSAGDFLLSAQLTKVTPS
jgi:hypothetical protein